MTEQMGTSGPKICTARCALKLSCTASEDAAAGCVISLKSFFKQARKLGDKKGFLGMKANAKINMTSPMKSEDSSQFINVPFSYFRICTLLTKITSHN